MAHNGTFNVQDYTSHTSYFLGYGGKWDFLHFSGFVSCVDRGHTSSFSGEFAFSSSSFSCVDDSTHIFSSSGYILSDYSYQPLATSSYKQGYMTGRTDMSMSFTDWTYCGGTWDSTTYVDGTRRERWFDPISINYSLWYVQDSSNPTLIGYRYNTPISDDVGRYYVPMVIPQTTGKYELRWRYQKDSSSYEKEIRCGFMVSSNGISPDRT